MRYVPPDEVHRSGARETHVPVFLTRQSQWPCGGKLVRADDVEAWVWTQVSAILRDPSLVAAELHRRQEAGPDPTALADRDQLQRRLGTYEKQQQRLIHHFREDESAPWELVRRELAQIEQDKRQVEAMLVAIEQRLAEQQMGVTQLEALETYCAQVSRQCERFDFDGKRLALEALDIQVTANGREWHLDGRIPVDDAGVVTQTSGCPDHLQRMAPACAPNGDEASPSVAECPMFTNVLWPWVFLSYTLRPEPHCPSARAQR